MLFTALHILIIYSCLNPVNFDRIFYFLGGKLKYMSYFLIDYIEIKINLILF